MKKRTLRTRPLLTGEEEESPERLDDGVRLAAAARAQVDAGDEEGDEQRDEAEGEQTLTRDVPVCNREGDGGQARGGRRARTHTHMHTHTHTHTDPDTRYTSLQQREGGGVRWVWTDTHAHILAHTRAHTQPHTQP